MPITKAAYEMATAEGGKIALGIADAFLGNFEIKAQEISAKRLLRPSSLRALEDQRQTALLKQARDDNGKMYGYRKLHDDLCNMGGEIGPGQAWQPACLAATMPWL